MVEESGKFEEYAASLNTSVQVGLEVRPLGSVNTVVDCHYMRGT